MDRVVVQAGQNIGDLAVQYCGDHQAVFEIAKLNNLSITADVPAGTTIIVPNAYNQRVVTFLNNGNYNPATNGGQVFEGIDFMAIEINFEVF